MPEPVAVNVLKVGARGPEVLGWQRFLVKQKLLAGPADFIFGEKTAQATSLFQQRQGLGVDGKVGKNTLKAAATFGYDPVRAGFWPEHPDFGPLASNKDRAALFGEFAFVGAPAVDEDAIRITDGWDKKNIAWVAVPQLRGVPGTSKRRGIQFHKKGVPQLLAMFQAIGDAGLADRILTFDGSFVPRFQRDSHTSLSTHSWGTSMDLNATWNRQGQPPAGLGMKGCLLEVVKIANDHGFYWGGHFSSRIDGMHFELARLQ